MHRLFLIVGLMSLCLSCTHSPSEKHEEDGQESDTVNTEAYKAVSDCDKLKAAARSMDSILLNATELKQEVGLKACEAFLNFVHYCGKDSACPIFLIKTAQVSQSIQNYAQARIALETCISDYPSFKNKPAALFLLGQLYDEPTQLNDEKKAKELYLQIIKEFPTNEWAQSAKGAMALLGKSDEEIVRQFNKNK